MICNPIEVRDKTGRKVVLRNAERSDAEALIKYVKATTAETPFLIREPDEFTMTVEQEEKFIEGVKNDPKALMLIAVIEGEHAGNCSLMTIAPFRRYAHRCEVAIALYQKYCGAGIGKIMLETVLSIAKETGYEQAELEVIKDNEKAISLYHKLGFEIYGTFPHNMKYTDGTYGDALWMRKVL